PEAAEEALSVAVAPWTERLPGGRWVDRDNWHMTLKFLGRTPPDLAAWVRASCREAAAESSPFDLRFTGLGVFPGPSRARVLWAGLDDASGRLAGLAEAVERRLETEFPREKRGFTPHLTVARFRAGLDVRADINDLRATAISSDPFRVDRLVLYRSHLSPRGARYEPVESFHLRG
ncbi:MAG: RNA 2',3'-cyclic phosphodiesterase, partial [Actinomycetota bacterium]|nr:RNA 2',3'-cyclic phosphodiesterase [Actinomycetota bacterium]